MLPDDIWNGWKVTSSGGIGVLTDGTLNAAINKYWRSLTFSAMAGEKVMLRVWARAKTGTGRVWIGTSTGATLSTVTVDSPVFRPVLVPYVVPSSTPVTLLTANVGIDAAAECEFRDPVLLVSGALRGIAFDGLGYDPLNRLGLYAGGVEVFALTAAGLIDPATGAVALSPQGTALVTSTIEGLAYGAPRATQRYVTDGSNNRGFVLSDGISWRYTDGSLARLTPALFDTTYAPGGRVSGRGNPGSVVSVEITLASPTAAGPADTIRTQPPFAGLGVIGATVSLEITLAVVPPPAVTVASADTIQTAPGFAGTGLSGASITLEIT